MLTRFRFSTHPSWTHQPFLNTLTNELERTTTERNKREATRTRAHVLLHHQRRIAIVAPDASTNNEPDDY